MLLSERFRRCAGHRRRGLRRRSVAARRRRFGGRVARLLDLELIVEHRLGERRRRLQAGHLEQPAVGAVHFRLHKTAGIGGRVDEIAGCAAARAETEAIERDQSGLRIAGHRISLERSSPVLMICAHHNALPG